MEFTGIGYFSKTHGIQGSLALKGDVEFLVDKTKVVFIEAAGSMAPYFVKEIKETNRFLVFNLEEVQTIEAANKLIGKKVFVESTLVSDEIDGQHPLLGYLLVDKKLGELGAIDEITDNGEQLLVKLNYKGKEVLLPLVEDFIESIDEGQKKMFFKAPDGLIDLYL